jgi:hypothetical protein
VNLWVFSAVSVTHTDDTAIITLNTRSYIFHLVEYYFFSHFTFHSTKASSVMLSFSHPGGYFQDSTDRSCLALIFACLSFLEMRFKGDSSKHKNLAPPRRTFIREVPGWILSLVSSYSNWGFYVIFSVIPSKCRGSTSNFNTVAFSFNPFNSPYIDIILFIPTLNNFCS